MSTLPGESRAPARFPGLRASALMPRLRGQQQRLLIAGLGLLALIILAVLLGPVLLGINPDTQNYSAVLQAPSGAHPFGTDQFGRDLLARTLVARRLDLVIAFGLVGISLVIGTAIGMVAAWFGGLLDTAVSRVIDIALAFPFLVLVIAIVGVRGPGVVSLFVAVSLVGWVFYARLTRGEVLVARRVDYMRAAQASGFSRTRMFLRHLLPNVVIQPLVYASSDLVYALLLGSSVSFLGLGVQPPTPEWGQMVSEGTTFITSQWWLAFFPGLAIVITGIAFSLIGDGIADRARSGH
jgi:peptide/nickel transport system permease protein